MKITIAGTGYVGLVTGTCFAEMGVDVTCVDIDERKIESLRRGENPIYEPGLDDLLRRGISSGRLHFSTSLADSIQDAGIVFIAVGTPPGEDGSADLSHVLGVARQIGAHLGHYTLVVTKSTVPVGTSAKVRTAIEQELRARGVEMEFDVASNPEFLKEGDAVNDFMRPDRVVVGADSERAVELMTQLYRPLMLNNFRVIFMDIASAEMTKYAANAMLATRISFMNDVANLCALIGADVNMVRQGIGSDTRIGNKFLYPGVGYGGSCFPKDVKALIRTAEDNGYDMRVLRAVEEVNERQKALLFERLTAYFGGDLSGRRIALWGLSFKPETDDVREAPSLVLARLITGAGAEVRAYDPVAGHSFGAAFDGDGRMIRCCDDKYEALRDCDALLLLTEWKEFRMPSFARMAELMKTPVIFDGRNIYDRKTATNAGFTYFGI